MEEHLKIKLNRHKAHDAVLIPERGLSLIAHKINTPEKNLRFKKAFLISLIKGDDLTLWDVINITYIDFEDEYPSLRTNINPN